jgi:membrane-associated protease RseP (regulator of RpoE activity)
VPDLQPDPQFPLPYSHPYVMVVRPPQRPYWLHALLFLLTIFTTLTVGARLQDNFQNGLPMFWIQDDLFPLRWVMLEPRRLLMGVPFSISLLSILFAHEMGHFIYCVRNRVYATLPYFIPAPTLLGTFGAFIKIKSPFHDRAALFDVGIAGPIAGFIVAAPLCVLGLLLSVPLNAATRETAFVFGMPAIFVVCNALIGGPVPVRELYLHPIAVAAWFGMFATALNLMPGGQLDGGHILYALKPRLHSTLSRVTAAALLLMSYFFWSGWAWVLLLIVATRHSAVPQYPQLPRSRIYWAIAALLMLGLTFVPAPFEGASIREMLLAR